MSELKIGVLGAGIVGLTTCLELKKEFRNASIEIVAEKFYDDTTSFVAAGIFIPTAGVFGSTEYITSKWVNDSYSYWDTIKSSSEASEAGVKQMAGYIFASEHRHIVRNKYLENLVPIYRQATEEELKICPGNWKYGSYFSTILTDPKRYLKWALNRILSHSNVKVQKEKINALSEINGKYDVVVNCTGLGGQTLCGDISLVSLRGQVSKVEAPWIKNFFFGNYDTYIIPSFDDITLGGCRQYDSYDTAFNNYDYLSMRERCEKMMPSLKDAKLIGHRVGLRPHRIPVRVEKEYRNVDGREMKIVHNYGHGGFGVTTAPGTAMNCVQLVKEVLIEKKSKL